MEIRDVLDRLGDDAHVKLFGVAVRGTGDQFFILRRDTGAMLRTNAIGADAVRLLQKGEPLGIVKQTIGRKCGYAAKDVNLVPLLHSLILKDLVRKLGDFKVPVKVKRSWLGVFRFVKRQAESWLVGLAIRRAPLFVTLRLVYWWPHLRDQATIKSIGMNLSRAPSLRLSGRQMSRLAHVNYDLVRRSQIDRIFLSALPPRHLDKWVRRYVSISGLEHIDRAIMAGRKIVLCGFHMGSYHLIPFVLAAAGYRITALVAPTEKKEIEERFAQIRNAGLDYRLNLVFGKLGLRNLVEALNDGQLVLILPDTIKPKCDRDCTVDLCGYHIRATPGITWLWQKTRPAIIPVYLRDTSRCRHQLILGHEITRPDGSPLINACEVSSMVYRRLEDVVCRNLDQWSRWKDLHHIICDHGV